MIIITIVNDIFGNTVSAYTWYTCIIISLVFIISWWNNSCVLISYLKNMP